MEQKQSDELWKGSKAMILAVDVYYYENKAKSVGVLFRNWEDPQPFRVISAFHENPLEYVPGSFYKRELPCILDLLRDVDTSQLNVVVVDGYVYLDNEMKPGLGHYVYESLGGAVPVIGVAKTAFHDNESVVTRVYRGKSSKPLYISSVGIEAEKAAEYIQNMSGTFRIPHLLKLLDMNTKSNLP